MIIIKPLFGNILVTPLEDDDGPTNFNHPLDPNCQPKQGKVLAVGSGEPIDSITSTSSLLLWPRVPLDVKVGDIVLYHGCDAIPVWSHDQGCYIIEQHEVIGIIQEDVEIKELDNRN